VAPWASRVARDRLGEIERGLRDRLTLPEVVDTVWGALEAHRRRFDENGIVLYAGTNVMSPAARSVHDPSLSSRPSMGWPGERYQAGLEGIDVIEVLAPTLVAQLMEAKFAEVRLQSATFANLAVYTALTQPGDTIAVLPASGGGHASHHAGGVPDIRGLRVVDLPYDVPRNDVDHDALPEFLRRERPRVVVIGGSLMLFPHDVAAVRAAVDEVGATLVYDASHMAGLVAARKFQRPLPEGAHVLTFSTYKSFGGPTGGCIATSDEDIAARISTTVYPGMVANYDAGRLGPLAVTAAEHLTQGPGYANSCIANARAFAQALHTEGFRVEGEQRGFTESHHVAVDATMFGGGGVAARRLAEAGIFLSGIGLPGRGGDDGLRIGTQEVTRRGFGEDELRRVAELARRVLIDLEDPATVLPDSVELRAEVTKAKLS
jgi:glycine hydroxymethyltransferase